MWQNISAPLFFLPSQFKKNSGDLNTKTPDLWSFTLTGLRDVGEEHGVNSQQDKDAQKIITDYLNQVSISCFFVLDQKVG